MFDRIHVSFKKIIFSFHHLKFLCFFTVRSHYFCKCPYSGSRKLLKIEKKQNHLNSKVFLCDQCLGKIKKKSSKTLLFLKAAVEMWCVTCVLLSIFDSITYNEAEGRYDAIGQAGISNPKRICYLCLTEIDLSQSRVVCCYKSQSRL